MQQDQGQVVDKSSRRAARWASWGGEECKSGRLGEVDVPDGRKTGKEWEEIWGK